VDDFEEADAVGELVVPSVVERREELLDDTHVRAGEVDGVVAGVDGAARRPPEVRGQAVHLVGREHSRRVVDEPQPVQRPQGPRRPRDGGLLQVRVLGPELRVPGLHAPQAAVFQLDRDPCAVVVNRRRQSLELGDERRVVDAGHPRRRTPALAPDDGRTLAEQSRARFRRRFQVRDQSVDGVGPVARTLQQRCAVQAVRDRHPADFDGVLQAGHGGAFGGGD